MRESDTKTEVKKPTNQQTHTHNQTHTQTQKHTETHRHTHTDTHTQTDTQTQTQTQKQTHTQHTKRQRYRGTAEKMTQRERDKESESRSWVESWSVRNPLLFIGGAVGVFCWGVNTPTGPTPLRIVFLLIP